MIVQIDMKALEWRVCVELAQEPTGLKEILEGQDAHSLNEKAFNLPSRLIAKKYLFRTIFNHGKGYAFTVDNEFMHVSTSVKYWDEVGKKFYTKYAAIDKLYETNNALVLAGKPLKGPLGREWPIELVKGWHGDLEVPETILVNYPVQGTGADIMTVARISFWNRLKTKPWRHLVKLIATIHDSVVVDCPVELAQEVVNLFHQVCDDLPKNIKRLFGYEWKTPLDCEASVGPNFKDTVEMKRNDL